MKNTYVAWGLSIALGLSTPLRAQDNVPHLDLIYAQKLANAALNICSAMGYKGSVSVVDAHNIVKLLLRADGSDKNPIAAQIKAQTALYFDQAGSDMLLREKSDPDFVAQLAAHKDVFNDHPGSVPIHVKGHLIGAIAMADISHEMADHCVREALSANPYE